MMCLDVIISHVVTERGEFDLVPFDVVGITEFTVKTEVYLSPDSQVVVHESDIIFTDLYADLLPVLPGEVDEFAATIEFSILQGLSGSGLHAAKIPEIMYAGSINHPSPAFGRELPAGQHPAAVRDRIGVAASRDEVPDEVT